MIIVTGMHRSGTSLTAQVLQALGADFGPADKLYDADQWNANGYLERVDAVDLNSRIITGHNRTTSRLAAVRSQVSYLRMPSGTQLDARLQAAADDASELGDSLRGLFVKDPRFCITAPAWTTTGNVTGLVVALRHPSASVASLRRRNRLPTSVGHRFWRWHMEQVLPLIGPETLVVRQDTLTGPDHATEVDRIRRWLTDVANVSVVPDTPSVLDRSLIHHQADDDAPTESQRLWDRLTTTPAWAPPER
jgi:hypothetical protein